MREQSIVHSATGGDYGDFTVDDMRVVIENTTVSTIAVADAWASESEGTIDFMVTVTPPLDGEAVTVDYLVEVGTAFADEDYQFTPARGQTTRTLTIPSGGSGAMISIPLVDRMLDEADEETFTLRLSNPTGAQFKGGGIAITATGTILDDDPAPVVTVEGPAGDISFVSEETDKSVTFTLKLKRTSGVVVSVEYETGALGPSIGFIGARSGFTQATEDVDYTPVSGTAEFQPGEKTKTVRVPLADDDLSEETEYFALIIRNPRNARITGRSGEDGAGVGMEDNDSRGVTVSPTWLDLTEPADGETAVAESYTVVLTSQPTADVRVAIEGAADAPVALDPTFLDFTPSNWKQEQTVTVTPRDDANASDETVTLSHAATGGDYEGLSGDSVTVTVRDTDSQGVSVSKTALALREGSSDTYTVRLDTEPSDTVTITVSGAGDASPSPGELAFTTGDWDTPQTVTVTAEEDHDAEDEPTVTVTHSVDGGDYGSVAAAGVAVTITDNDAPAVTASFEQSSYTVDEGGTVEVTVTLSLDPEREVVIPLTAAAQGETSADDYSVVDRVTFASGETEQSFVFEATDDAENDDGESVVLGFGSILPAGVSAGTTAESTVTITDDEVPAVTASFDQATYTVDEGSTVEVTVTLNIEPEREVVIPITAAAQGETSADDYSAVDRVTFASGETEQSFVFEATDDDENDDGESVVLGFGSILPAGVSAGTTAESTVSITDDDDPPVTASFGQSSYTVDEGSSVTVTVTLDIDPEREVIIPLTAAAQGETSADDYSVFDRVTFASGETEQSFVFEATDDDLDDDGESVVLGFGSILPAGVSAGTTAESTVSITDDDDPRVEVSFEQSSYTVDEGSSVTVKVTLSEDPEREVIIPLTAAAQGETSADDYSVVDRVTFNAGDTTRSFVFEATADDLDDDGESVVLGFGSILPAGVSAGTTAESAVSITDDDDPRVEVSFEQSSYTVDEGSSVTVKVTLSEDPEREVTIPVTTTENGGADAGDYSGAPVNVTFARGETEKSITFEATQDTDNDDGESVRLSFGTLPDQVTAGATSEATVSITDDDVPPVTISFGQAAYTAAEGSSVEVTVTLDIDPEGTVTVPITKTDQDGATGADYSGVPANVIFNSGDTAQTFTFTATQDTDNDDGESVVLGFGSILPAGVSAGTTAESTVSITDDDDPPVTASFEASTYTVAEGSPVTVRVTLSADPERTVTIPLSKTDQDGATSADYSLSTTNLTFNAGDTEKEVTFTATDDAEDDDGESVRLAFGALPDQVTAGATSAATVSITDDDVPSVTVSFEQVEYTVAEGSPVTVTVTLSVDPERTVEVPITVTPQDGATGADYSVAPSSVTFNSGDTAQTFTFTATQDTDNDDGERVRLSFGALPDQVTAGATSEATVSITDNDVPSVMASFEQAAYTVAEGSPVTVTVTLSVDPERTVEVPITVTPQDGASGADYSVAPSSVTFNAGDTQKTITFTATEDAEDDDDESVRLSFGTLPDQVTAGTPSEATVSITDDDVPSVTISFEQAAYTVAEGSPVTVTVTLSVDPERTVEVPITVTPQDGATAADYSGVPANVTFDTGETSKSFTLTATQDTDNDDGGEREAESWSAARWGDRGEHGHFHGLHHGRRRAVRHDQLRLGDILGD